MERIHVRFNLRPTHENVAIIYFGRICSLMHVVHINGKRTGQQCMA